MSAGPGPRPAAPALTQAVAPLLHWLLGADKGTRARTLGTGLVTLVYVLCCLAAWHASGVGIMRPWAWTVLAAIALPANLVALALVRSGWSAHLPDPSMMTVQNTTAVTAIAFAYLAITPPDRGVVFMLLALVIVFGMYTYTPRHALTIGVVAIAGLGISTLVLAQIDPGYYPFRRELLRFELLVGVLPVLVATAVLLAHWRTRLRRQREELSAALARVQHLVTRDALTGLFNRRYMQERLDGIAGRRSRYGEHFTLALIDLDHFKAVNDQHGHRVGDEVLASFALAAAEVLRDSDVLGRWGGEEFLVIFPDCTPLQALRPLRRLQATLQARAVSSRVPQLRLTFSAGVCLHEGGATVDQTLERADAALYEAKHRGRDQVIVAGGDAGVDTGVDARVDTGAMPASPAVTTAGAAAATAGRAFSTPRY